MTAALLLVLAYLLGSFSPSVVFGKAFKGMDVREHGSGNAGATNAFRVLGTRLGIAVLLADMLKGFTPVLAARLLTEPWITVVVALAAMAGHNYSIFLRGKGGKGVATGAGTVVAMMPVISGVIIAVFLVVLTVTSVVSVASLTATMLLPVLAIATAKPAAYIAFSVAGAAIVVWAHRGNIGRLLRGEERRANIPWVPPRRRRGTP